MNQTPSAEHSVEVLVEIEGLRKVYRTDGLETYAIKGIDLTVCRGEFVAIFGPSGSGKTTLLNLIGGLDFPTEGSVKIGGIDITRLKKSDLAEFRLRNIGFIFQNYNLIDVLTALENTEFVLLLRRVEKKKRVEKCVNILKEVGLEDYIMRRPVEMSGGQQQRVAIARAIVSEPLLVLADEPTANLDSKTASHLMDIMTLMNREKGVTFIFSTHDPLVMSYAKRKIKLRDGRIEGDETL